MRRGEATPDNRGRGWAPKARRIAAGHRGVARARFGLGLLPQTLDDGGDVGQSLLRYRQPPWLEPEEAHQPLSLGIARAARLVGTLVARAEDVLRSETGLVLAIHWQPRELIVRDEKARAVREVSLSASAEAASAAATVAPSAMSTVSSSMTSDALSLA
mgnify:CR=1 FL=1